MYELFNRAVNLTKRLSSTGENNGRKLCEYESTTPELCSKSHLLLQVLSDAAPDPGFAPKCRSQPPWVHISEKDKVSTEVTRADLLSSAGDTLNQNCVCGAWPFSWLSSHLWRTRRGKRGEGWRRHSKLGSLLFLRVLRQTQLAASHCNDYPATKSFHSPPNTEKKLHTFHLYRCSSLYITQEIVDHVAHIYLVAIFEPQPATSAPACGGDFMFATT